MSPTNRLTVKTNIAEMKSQSKAPDFMRITGGSTAEPIQMPAWREEAKFTSYDMWLARSWYGISPASKLFMIWGHSHLLGSGFSGVVNKYKRMLYDYILGYRRFSAYDLKDDAMREAGDFMLKFRPDYVIGYSVALDRFVKVNMERKNAFRNLRLKAVIAAAEAFPFPDSRDLLKDFFNCPVGMEYGSVETALIAHTHPEGGYKVFWQSYFVEAERNKLGAGYIIRVTSLYPRCFPLIRYEIGDEIVLHNTSQERLFGVTEFDNVLGRCNDYVELKDSSLIHSEAFTHAIRWCPEVVAYQVVQDKERICLNYIAKDTLSRATKEMILSKLKKVHPLLGEVEFVKVNELKRTIAGKTPMILRYK